MTNTELMTLMEATFKEIRRLRDLKGGEYASGIDALDNFKSNARDCGCDPILVWRVYAGKHWNAISTFVKDINAGKERIRSESIGGRVDDLINYLILFKGLLSDRNEPKPGHVNYATD